MSKSLDSSDLSTPPPQFVVLYPKGRLCQNHAIYFGENRNMCLLAKVLVQLTILCLCPESCFPMGGRFPDATSALLIA